MKALRLTILCVVAFALSARGEAQFPAYEGLSPEEKAAWGYTVENRNAMFHLVIPPKAAKAYRGARLYFKDRRGNLLAEVNTGLSRAVDGSLSINIDLFDGLSKAELIIYTDYVSGGPLLGDFGGFTFVVSAEQ